MGDTQCVSIYVQRVIFRPTAVEMVGHTEFQVPIQSENKQHSLTPALVIQCTFKSKKH